MHGKNNAAAFHTSLTDYIITKTDATRQLTSFTSLQTKIPTYLLMWSSEQNNGDIWIASSDKGIIKFKAGNL